MRALALCPAFAAGPAAAQVAGPCPTPLPAGTARAFADGAIRVNVPGGDGGQGLYVEAAGTCTAIGADATTPVDVAALTSAQQEAHPTRGVTIHMPIRTLVVESEGQEVHALGLTAEPAIGALTLKRLAGGCGQQGAVWPGSASRRHVRPAIRLILPRSRVCP